MTQEASLRKEIAHRAPHLTVLSVGPLFGRTQIDAIVEDRHGQYLWSTYARELDPQPIAPAEADLLPGQLNLF